MKIQFTHKFEDIISLENLFSAWQEFLRGKRNKTDVQIFSRDLADNIISLHEDLANKTYRHGGYESFFVNDPKRRHIHKASVRDRLVHHAVHRQLYPFFDRTFIADSFSCRLDKGTHRAINRFRAMAYTVSQNHTTSCFVLKCDIRKFFASIHHGLLLNILQEYIPDKDIMWLLGEIIGSFNCPLVKGGAPQNAGRGIFLLHEITVHPRQGGNLKIPLRPPLTRGHANGLPLGNLTSQLFANIYMNQLDQWVKHSLKVGYYIRYADDFVFLSEDKKKLEDLIAPIRKFLDEKLCLSLHEDKVFIKTIASGADFLGWVQFTDHRILRKTTKHRMFWRTRENPATETLQSYLGLLKHGNTFKVKKNILISARACQKKINMIN
jgi:retron-type reverse transcriptase